MSRILVLLLLFGVISTPALSQPANNLPRSVLVLEESDAIRGPFYAAMFAALRSRLASSGIPISIYIENLDLAFFSGREYEVGLRSLLHEKYKDRPIGVVVAIGVGALDRAMKWRSELWPGTPIVFALVNETEIASFPRDPGVTGTTVRLRLEDMVTAARAVVKDLNQVVLLGEPFESVAAAIFKHFVKEVPAATAGLEVIDLTGQPLDQVKRRVSSLPDRSAILYTPIYTDGAGAYVPAVETVAMIVASANRPMVTPVESHVGRGAIGGFVLIPSTIGTEAGDQVLQLLAGKAPSDIPIVQGNALRPVFDWNLMQRWDVGEDSLPAGSEIRNRPVMFWMQYPWQTAAIAATVLFQSAFIVMLLREFRRRQRAEMSARTL